MKTIRKKKTLVSNFWFIGESVVNKFINGLKNRQSEQKKKTYFIMSVFLSGSLSYNQKNTICNSVNIFICLSVYLLVNITYYRQNIIYNFVEELTIEVTFTIILFQLFGIYRLMWFIDNPVSNILKYIYF